MITRTHKLLSTFALVACFTACSSQGEDASPAGAIAGHWSQDTGSDQKGMTLEFDSESDKMLVHTAPDETGAHAHLKGTYTIDTKSGEVSVECALNGRGNGDSWKGKLAGEHLTLTAGDSTLSFHKGEDPHGHE